jgi:hypothetical protein
VKHHWGRDDLMAIAAVRYCLGRMTYIVGDCCDWLPWAWPHLSESARKTILRDLDEAIAQDSKGRELGLQYKALGMDMDRANWLAVRERLRLVETQTCPQASHDA